MGTEIAKSKELNLHNKMKNTAKIAGGGCKRIGYIDALKGFAIICVVIGHVADGYLSAEIYPESYEFLYSIYNLICSFHMPLFMMISGFVFCTAYVHDGVPDTKRIYKQVLNLIVIYFIFSISFGLFKVAVGKFTNKPISVTDIFLILLKPIYPYWYLYILIFLYLIFSVDVLYKINKCVLVTSFALLALVSQLFTFSYFEINKLLYYALFFYVGTFLKSCNINTLKAKILIAVLFCISVTLIALLWNNERDINSYFAASIIIALGISLTLWHLFVNVGLLGSSSLLQTVGRYSLEIYVIHCVFTAGLRIVFPKIEIENIYVIVILNTAISTIIPMIFSVICKTFNIHGLLFKPVTWISNFINSEKCNNC